MKFLRWTLKLAVSLVLIMVVLLVCFFSLESVYPVTVTRDTLTNGEKTLVVEGMSHVGTPRFYADIRASILHEKSMGAVYLYEGVRDEATVKPPSPGVSAHRTAAVEITDILVGGDMGDGVDITRLYSVLAKSAGLEVQPQESFMDIAGGPDVNADMSSQELLSRLRLSRDRRAGTSVKPPASGTTEAAGVGKDIIDLDRLDASLDNMSVRERAVIGFLVKGLMSSVLRMTDSLNMLPYSEDIDTARTHRLAQFVQERTEKHMVSTYGTRHISGLLDELRALDSRWERIDRTLRQPFVE